MHTYTNINTYTKCCCNAGHKVQICLCKRTVSQNVCATSSIPLTHGESVVFQGHLSCEREAVAKPFISRNFKKQNYTLIFFFNLVKSSLDKTLATKQPKSSSLCFGIKCELKISIQSLNLGLKLHFLSLKNIDGITLVSGSHFRPGALQEHLHQQFGSFDVCALSYEHPLAQQLKHTVSPSVAQDDKWSH